MTNITKLIANAEAGQDGFGVLLSNSDWEEIKRLLNHAYPNLVPVNVGDTFVMNTKKGRAVVKCTKENTKTWVMYEVEGSARPGVRWMIHKTWCVTKNIKPVITDAQIPNWIRIK